jgi:hypothetical protein
VQQKQAFLYSSSILFRVAKTTCPKFSSILFGATRTSFPLLLLYSLKISAFVVFSASIKRYKKKGVVIVRLHGNVTGSILQAKPLPPGDDIHEIETV